MRDLIEGFGYYLSCMMLFNGIYSVKIIAEGNVHVKPCNPREWAITLTCSIATLLVILGAAFTFKILGIVDSLFDYSIYECSGIDPITKKALTGSIYFLVKGMRISIGDVIKYKNINGDIFRLNLREKI